jgi:hypothetical protein
MNYKQIKLCQTKPISEMPKIAVTLIMTITNNKKERSISYQKQSQTKPILPAIAGKIALPALGCRYRGSKVEGPVTNPENRAQSRDLSKQLLPHLINTRIMLLRFYPPQAG